ncbi:MAG: enolase C-terminal domain-like protein [Litorilinea sp.]
MKITEVRAVEIDLQPRPTTQPRTPSRSLTTDMGRPIDRYPGMHKVGFPRFWKRAAVVITTEDGTWGFGITVHGGPVVRIINDHLAPLLIGQNCMATEMLWDVMTRAVAAYGSTGITSYAISAVDVALWDLKGKVLQRPVYELLGGPQKDKIFCYATGFDTEWYMELGFKATKLFTPYGPQDGLDGLHKNVEMVAQAREVVGDRVELMLDCWLSMDVEHTVRLAEMLRPYGLKWLEDYVHPEQYDAYEAVRTRIPWQTLASGEHWYMPHNFATAAARRLVDIFQPDILWGGGITAAVKICHIAEAHGISVISHAGMNYPFGQHLAYAMPAIPWGERSESVSAPGVPLEEMTLLPGTPVIKDGYVKPSDAPGFGLEVTFDWLEQHTI